MSKYRGIWGVIILAVLLCFSMSASAFVRGIYITQSTASHSRKMNYLIQQANSLGIATFIVDAKHRSSRYARNIKKLHKAGIHYVARIVVFPYGGDHSQVTDSAYWAKRWKIVQYAVSLGAEAIQLDYIRYKSKHYSSQENAKHIQKVIEYFRRRLKGTGGAITNRYFRSGGSQAF